MPAATATKNRNRRFTACHRHPSEPVTGFCALCLRDRLAGLDDIDSDLGKNVVVCSRRTKGHGVGAPAPVPELRRSKSVVGEYEEGIKKVVMDQRRSSCDVRPRTSLSDLFEVEIVKLNSSSTIIENVGNENEAEDRVVENEENADLKTMKEIIEIELQNKRKNIWETASEKMKKWRQKQKEKKQKNRLMLRKLGNNTESEISEYGYGRRSCDTEPRFSVDIPHRLSVDESRIFYEEHRASWDGYMIAKTIPTLTPILSGVENGINRIENLQMQSISEDGVSSGGSRQSNSDCCGSNRGSSSSSSTKTVGVDDVKLGSNAKVSPANDVIFQGTKLVITEKELKDWRLNSVNKNEKVEPVSTEPALGSSKMSVNTNESNVRKKGMSSSWRKVCNLWGHKHKVEDKNGDKKNVEHTPINAFERGISRKLVPNPGSVNSRNRIEHSGRDLVLDRNRSTRYSTSDIDSGLLRLYLTPFRNSRRSKSGKSRAPLMASNGLQLN
uniref:protein OCTOPUS-like n=1 Tax=Erigeron canadensis TaxID=72917 RepID=UPI001CB9988C|nr:protein OCTOPUS-like [Erigeron canadensis]